MRNLIELMEQMQFAILLESTPRAAYLLKTYGAKLEAKWQAHPEPADIATAVQAQPGESIAEQLIAYLLSFDPTRNQQNGQWLTLRYLKDGMPLEDLEGARELLTQFEAMKQARTLPAGHTDINLVKSLPDLARLVRGAETEIVTADQAEQQRMAAQAEVLYDGPTCNILVPKTQAAACFYGRNSDWCTAWGDHEAQGLSKQGRYPTRSNRYEHAASSGPLYIITLKAADQGQDRIVQYHPGPSNPEFKDSTNRELTGEAVRDLLTRYPMVKQVIGPGNFAKTHLSALGLSFFSKQDIAGMEPAALARAIHSKADFDALPDVAKTDAFIAALMMQNPQQVKALIPHTYLTAGVAAMLRERVGFMSGYIVDLFDNFPLREWPPEAISKATRDGRLSYEQFMELPETERTPEQLKALLVASASKNVANIASFPEGLIGRMGATGDILRANGKAVQALKPDDLLDDDIVAYAQNGYDAARQLAYVPPDRLTDAVVARINALPEFNYTKIKPGAEGQAQFRDTWVRRVGAQEDLQKAVEDKSQDIPLRFRGDPSFWQAVMPIYVAGGRSGNHRSNAGSRAASSNNQADRARLFIVNLPPKMVTSAMLETMIQWQKPLGDVADYYRDQHRPFLFRFRRLWTDRFISTALVKGLLKPADLTEDEVTPAIAGVMFRLDPEHQQAMAHKADDAALIQAIDAASYNAYLIDHIPADRITEPVAYAAVTKSAVPTAKKRFPKGALSKRVYYEGLPNTFDLKDVPKKWRDDAMTLRAVSRSTDQLKFVPEPLAWLNAHKADLSNIGEHWSLSLERRGIVATKDGFAHIAALPSERLDGGFMLYKAELPKKTQRWFLRKGDTTIAVLVIKNGKLRLMNEHPDKDLAPVLREIATKFLASVADISILNKVGIYRDRDGSIRPAEASRSQASEKIIEGIGWSHTAHLKGTLYTAWKDDTAILTVYVAASGGWGGGYNKIQKVEILNRTLGMANNAALLKGVQDIRRDPENGRWELMNIGIGWKEKWGLWIMTEKPMGKVGPFQVFYSPSHRVISIFGDKGIAAYCGVLNTGKTAHEHILSWHYEKDAKLLAPTLAATAAKIGPVVKTTPVAKPVRR